MSWNGCVGMYSGCGEIHAPSQGMARFRLCFFTSRVSSCRDIYRSAFRTLDLLHIRRPMASNNVNTSKAFLLRAVVVLLCCCIVIE